MSANKKRTVDSAQENQHLLKALSVRVRFSCKRQKFHNNSDWTRWTLASLLHEKIQRARRAVPQSCEELPRYVHYAIIPRVESSNMVQGCLLEAHCGDSRVEEGTKEKEQRVHQFPPVSWKVPPSPSAFISLAEILCYGHTQLQERLGDGVIIYSG